MPSDSIFLIIPYINNSHFLISMHQVNAITELIQNEDFNIISQSAVVNNDDVDAMLEEEELGNESDIDDSTLR